MNYSRQTIFSLYRSYIRETKRLPHKYLRLFFRLKAADEFRTVLQTKHISLRIKKIKRESKSLNILRAANAGNHLAFNRVLDLAYGRAGKLRWELMEPLLSDPSAPLPPPIIREKESSRPPVYSPELAALLTSGLSRRTKPLSPKDLSFPPTLPERANPMSEEAALLGPFSKRREVNIRWRYFTKEWKKILPPLKISLEEHSLVEEAGIVKEPASPIDLRGIGFHDTNVLEEVLYLAGRPWERQQRTRRLKHNSNESTSPVISPFDGHLPKRWLQRRYQELLGRLPILSIYRSTQSRSESSLKYNVSLSGNALIPSRRNSKRLPWASEGDIEWMTAARKQKIEAATIE